MIGRLAAMTAVVLFGSGCMANAYYPALGHAPLMMKAHQGEAAVHPDPAGVQAQAAYAISDYLEVHGAGDAKVGNASADAGLGIFKGEMAENGYGWRVAAAVDVGAGSVSQSAYLYDFGGGNSQWKKGTGQYVRTSLQFQGGLVTERGGALQFVLRSTQASGRFDASGHDPVSCAHENCTSQELASGDYSGSVQSLTLFEPMIVARIPIARSSVAFEMQAGVSSGTAADPKVEAARWPLIVGAGLVKRF